MTVIHIARMAPRISPNGIVEDSGGSKVATEVSPVRWIEEPDIYRVL